MIYPRLILSRELLGEDGVIFISIDDREADNLRCLCREIFGDKNVETMIWKKRWDSGRGRR
jgi:adenine-specific DNA-methyltransferase